MADLAKSTSAIANRLKEAKAAYYTAVNNKESSTIVSRAKVAFDEAQKAYDLSAPQRGDITAAKEEMAYALGEPYRRDRMPIADDPTDDPTDEVIGEEVTLEEVPSDDVPDTGEDNAPARYNLDGSGKNPVVDKNTGQIIYTAPDGKIFTNIDLYNAYLGKLKEDDKRERGQSAYEILYEEFDRYGLGSLVKEIEEFIKDGLSKAELTLKLRGTTSYKKRFKANEDRIENGLAAISEAEYLALEDQYQNIMRNYGLPASYYTKGDLGVQEGFQKFIANDVSATELEDRIMTAQNRVINSNPEVLASLKSFYPEITNGDILAYALDPTNGKDLIKRKVTAAEIGGAATQAGLKTGMTRAEELGAAGITKVQAQQGFETVAGGAPRGGQLASIYGQDPYTQTTAETEVFGLAGKTEAAKQRKKITGLEKATFSGQSGATSSALVRDRAGAY